METIALGLALVFMTLIAVGLWEEVRYERRRNDSIEHAQVIIAQNLGKLLQQKPVTAQDMLDNKKKRPFFTHRSWKEEQAELEAKDDKEKQQHDKLVAEIEKEKP